MKKYIKTALLVLVVAGIVALVAVYVHTIGAGVEDKIAIPSYERTVAAHVKSYLMDKPYDVAQQAFDSIRTSIATQASITLTDGEPAVTSEEVEHSKQYLFDGYAPIVVQTAEETFSQSSWNTDQLRSLRTQSQTLLAMGVAERGTEIVGQLNSICANVNDYFAAFALAATASRCTTVAGVLAIRSGVARYKRSPLTNNTRLMAALNAAPSQAKTTCANALAAKARAVCNYRRYSSYESFDAACNSVRRQINSYTQALGRNASLSSALSNLKRADYEALNYFVNLI